MSSYTVTNNLTLRSYYSTYRTLAVKSNRSNVTTSQLNYADAQALRRAVRKLDDFDFSNASQKDIEEHVRALIDTYNNTLDSAQQSDNANIKSIYKKLQQLNDTYQDDLENIGIRTNSSGYLTLSSSASSNISSSKFSKFLGGDSTFMKKLSTYAKRIANHVDYYA